MAKKEEHQFLTTLDLEKQENLNLEILKRFTPDKSILPSRPTDSFLELMNWTLDNFKNHLGNELDLNKYVHNRIIIDGQFMQFAKENNISINCLYKDSIISWKTEHEYEKFFVQGVFLIESKDVKFIHAALYHKGNQHEDEISFFIICHNDEFEKYIELRNKFDQWVQSRDRSNLHVRVIDGDDFPYTKDYIWDDLFLPEKEKNAIKSSVENFLESKDFYTKNKIPWKRGLFLFGKPGNGKSSIIKTIMSMYPFKPVTITAGANDETVREAFSYAEEQSPALLYFEELDSLLEKSVDISLFLNLMDGIEAKNGLFVIATANDIKKLKTNITDRPSRFDRKFEIPLPSQKMAYIYLKRWFGEIFPDSKYKELAKYAENYEFSYVHLKELYISTMFEALGANRKVPIVKDVDNALKILVNDKNMINSGKINMNKYLKKKNKES
jgi:ATPase family associated with various cellular activities (AAA)